MIYTLVIILTILAAILLIGVVLIQKSKGGGLGSTFASSNSILGVKRTNDVIEKVTWWLAGIICFLSVVSVFVAPALTTGTEIRTTIEETPAVPALDINAQSAAEAPAAEAPAAEAPAN